MKIGESRARDVPTVIAISVVCFLLTIQFHEFAHATTASLLGAKLWTITSGSVRYDDRMLSNHGNQAVAAAGTIFNFAVALLLVGVRKMVPRASPRARFALWLGIALNAFAPAGYLAFSPFFGFGDWTIFLRYGAEPRLAWQIGLTVVGFVLYFLVIPLMIRGDIEPFLGRAEPERNTRKQIFTLVPWLAGSFAMTGSAFLNTRGLGVVFTNALGTFCGTIGIAQLGWVWLKSVPHDSPEVPLPVERSVAWIVVAAVLFVIELVVFGRGLALG